MGPGDPAGDRRDATLRSAGASLTATARRAPFDGYGRRAREGAR
ncbi:DUF6380 family protein [Streptomyces brasiliensis]